MGLLFSFEGRINRKKFWLAVLIYVIFLVVLALLIAIPKVGWLLAGVGYVGMLVSSVFVAIKRLHDRNKPGWWVAVFYLIPMILSGASAYLSFNAGEQTPMAMLISLISLAISLWAFIELGCLRGTVGPNQYGPDPIAPQPGH
jgi:uncharacterized membrane protein YhaH (DUF805 family)